ncbi:MAG: hypothetical protein ABSG34_11815 [Candidatus Sulfotelmatobacter sp.]|jgi:hypothetical protein
MFLSFDFVVAAMWVTLSAIRTAIDDPSLSTASPWTGPYAATRITVEERPFQGREKRSCHEVGL